MNRALQWVSTRLIDWLMRDGPPSVQYMCDFQRLGEEVRPADVLLVQGRSRVATVINLISQSTWTHAAIYIGRLRDIHDKSLRRMITRSYRAHPDEQLVIEALLGKGTVVAPLYKYHQDHVRICRPNGLERRDARMVIHYCIERVGSGYDLRQLLDLARFVFPWSVLPRRWRSSLFEHNAGSFTRTVCSSLLAEAFGEVDFPVLPFIERRGDGSLRFYKRNTKLFTPRDFDHSPYFGVIKYPFLGIDEIGLYHKLPWSHRDLIYNDEEERFAARLRVSRDGTNPAAARSAEQRPRGRLDAGVQRIATLKTGATRAAHKATSRLAAFPFMKKGA